jgi:indolepyruvate ferredoxin oxidoreductase, beta subunit
MAFDDTIRVAELKTRASRFARIRREVGAGERDIVRIVEYLRPGVPEIAGMLPPSLARALHGWDRRRVARGKEPFTLRLALRSDGAWGFVALRMLARLKRLRRASARYAEEQQLIERWLEAIDAATRAGWGCGHELALAGRLIKGYGATNERGKQNLIWIIDKLAGGVTVANAAERAAAIRDAREAALADEAGTALDAALARHGAPPRALKAQPIVWARAAVQRGKTETRPPA